MTFCQRSISEVFDIFFLKRKNCPRPHTHTKSKDAIGSGSSIMNVSLKTKVHDTIVKSLSTEVMQKKRYRRTFIGE